jgi:phosphatidylethanolamine N-methyltransferase
MRKLYGADLRKDAGLTKTIKKVTRTQAKLLKQRAPELERVDQEVRGTFDKVYADTAHIVEEFLAKCTCHDCSCRNDSPIVGLSAKPRIEGVVQDSKVLLQQTRERLVIT